VADLDLQELFPSASGYLNTASLGLPPGPAVDRLAHAIEVWAGGDAEPVGYDRAVIESRSLFASLVGVGVDSVAVGSQVSGFVGLAAASLPPGATVLCADGEFTSVLFPFLVRDDITVRSVPFERLVEDIEPGVTMVAVSLVRSDDGRVADLAGITAAAEASGTATLIDATQAAGWLPIDASSIDILVAGAYKWLLSPKGTAFMTVRPAQLARLTPIHAGWYAGESPWDSIYGAPLRLAASARRFDLSPAWLSWVGTAPALRLIEEIGVDAINRHDVGLANACRAALDLEPGDSAVLSIGLPEHWDPDRARDIRASVRAGRLRLSFHLYNTIDDVDRVVDLLGR